MDGTCKQRKCLKKKRRKMSHIHNYKKTVGISLLRNDEGERGECNNQTAVG